MVSLKNTKTRALDEAKRLTQTFGFQGFSFQTIADVIGIKKPSLYTHFASKEELGLCIIEDFYSDFRTWTEAVAIFEPEEKIRALFELYIKYADKDQCCPFSAISRDYQSLPEEMKKSFRKFSAFNQEWLMSVIEQGQKKKIFRRDLSSEALADIVMAMSYGSQNIARIFAEPEKIRTLKDQTLKILQG